MRIGPSVELRGDPVPAGEAALGAAALRQSEDEVRLDRRGVVVEIVAVERQARLEPQRIARAEADRLHLGLVGEQVGDRLGRRGGHRNLEAVLAGIARAADPGLGPAELERARRS